MVAASVVGQGAETELRDEIEALKRGQQEIQKQLEEIKKLLQARPAAPAPAPTANVRDVVFNLGENVVRGSNQAKVTLIEFTDYQCPYCGQYARDTYPQIAKEYVDTGKVRYVLLDLPLEAIHKSAIKAAEATHCAGDQGKFWEMHDRLFANQRALEPWKGHAEAVGLDVAAFEKCMTDGRHTTAVRADMAQAASNGITGTPGFVLALTDSTDPRKAKGLTYLRGAQPFTSFKTSIDQALAAN
jgi:protein-disulfide isomerase